MIKDIVRQKFQKPHISVFDVKKYFGGGRTRAFAFLYDNEDFYKKIESPYRIKRVEIEKLAPKDRKKKEKKDSRKVKKVKKHQEQKKDGTKRRQEIKLARKLKKKKK
jgi:ribosomal protein S24E